VAAERMPLKLRLVMRKSLFFMGRICESGSSSR
jgi:hypothetical protein